MLCILFIFTGIMSLQFLDSSNKLFVTIDSSKKLFVTIYGVIVYVCVCVCVCVCVSTPGRAYYNG